MVCHDERRKYRRFEIPGAKVKVKKPSAFFLMKKFSYHPVLNLSIGGIKILFDRELGRGRVIQLYLIVPGEKSLEYHARIIWTKPVPISGDVITSLDFLPFDENKEHNSTEAMNLLRRLYARYTDR